MLVAAIKSNMLRTAIRHINLAHNSIPDELLAKITKLLELLMKSQARTKRANDNSEPISIPGSAPVPTRSGKSEVTSSQGKRTPLHKQLLSKYLQSKNNPGSRSGSVSRSSSPHFIDDISPPNMLPHITENLRAPATLDDSILIVEDMDFNDEL